MIKKLERITIFTLLIAFCGIQYFALADNGRETTLSWELETYFAPKGDIYQLRSSVDQERAVEILAYNYYTQETQLSYLISDETGKWGYWDKASGTLILPCYDEIYDYFATAEDSPILVGKDGKYGYLERSTGTPIIPFRYNSYCDYSEFRNGYAVVCNEKNTNEDEYEMQYALIDQNGHETIFPKGIIPIGYLRDQLVLIASIDSTAKDWYVYGIGNLQGEIVIPPIFDINDEDRLEQFYSLF